MGRLFHEVGNHTQKLNRSFQSAYHLSLSRFHVPPKATKQQQPDSTTRSLDSVNAFSDLSRATCRLGYYSMWLKVVESDPSSGFSNGFQLYHIQEIIICITTASKGPPKSRAPLCWLLYQHRVRDSPYPKEFTIQVVKSDERWELESTCIPIL